MGAGRSSPSTSNLGNVHGLHPVPVGSATNGCSADPVPPGLSLVTFSAAF